MSKSFRKLMEYLDDHEIYYTRSPMGGLIFKRDDGAEFLVSNAYGELSVYRTCRSIEEVIAEIFGDEE